MKSIEGLEPAFPLSRAALERLGIDGLNIGCGAHFVRDYGDERFLYCDIDPPAPAAEDARTLWRMDGRYHYIRYRAPAALPMGDSAVVRVFCEHVLEHLEPFVAVSLLKEARRVLEPEGMLRVSVPDLAQYVAGYIDSARKFQLAHAERIRNILADPTFPDGVRVGLAGSGGDTSAAERFLSRRASMFNQLFYFWGHRWNYDFEELAFRLVEAGFPPEHIQPVGFRSGSDSRLAALDTAFHADETLYVEVRRL